MAKLILDNLSFNAPARTTDEEVKASIEKWLQKHKRYWADAPNEWLLDKHQHIFSEIFSMKEMEQRAIVFYLDSICSLRSYLDRLIEKNKIQSTILPSLIEWREEIEHIYLLMITLDENYKEQS